MMVTAGLAGRALRATTLWATCFLWVALANAPVVLVQKTKKMAPNRIRSPLVRRDIPRDYNASSHCIMIPAASEDSLGKWLLFAVLPQLLQRPVGVSVQLRVVFPHRWAAVAESPGNLRPWEDQKMTEA